MNMDAELVKATWAIATSTYSLAIATWVLAVSSAVIAISIAVLSRRQGKEIVSAIEGNSPE